MLLIIAETHWFEMRLLLQELFQSVLESEDDAVMDRVSKPVTLMTIQDILNEKRETILEIAAKHGARNVRTFGSIARNETVSTTENTSPWFPVGLIHELEDVLHCQVDVVTEDSLYWLLRRQILKEAKPLWLFKLL